MDNSNQHIRAILDDFDYAEGIHLLKKYGSNPALVAVLNGRSGKFFEKKLRRELAELLHKEDAPAPAPLADAPEPVKAIEKTRNDALRRQDHLRGQLVLLVEQKATPQVLAPIAREIRSLSRELRDCWAKLTYYQEHRTLPPQAPDVIVREFEGLTSVSDVMRIRNNARSNISRIKKGKVAADRLPYWEAIRLEADRRITLMEA